MKNKLVVALCLAGYMANAQIKVYSGGKVAFGSTSTTPNYIKRLLKTLILAATISYSLLTNKVSAQLCFTPPDSFAIGTNPAALVSADFNGDGKVDLVTANWNANDVSIFLGTGTGSFGAATNFTVGSNPQALITEDFNGDGKVDLAVVNESSSNVSILLNTSTSTVTATFGIQTTFAVGTNPYCITSADFNGDGKPDLATGNSGGASTNNVSVLLGTGTGSFISYPTTISFSQSIPYTIISITSADFNMDGKADLALTLNLLTDVYVSLGSGTGSFGAVSTFPVGSSPFVMSVDLNGDGKPDLATANANSNNVSVLLGTGSGSFSTATNYAVGTHPAPVISGDFNKDGIADLVVSNDQSANISVLLGTGGGNFSTATNFSAGATVKDDIISADFNGDTMPDLALAGGDIYLLLSCSTMGIEQFAGTNEVVKVYPNPATNTLQVAVGNAELTEVKLIDMLGKEIINTKEKDIDVSGLQEGVYFVSIKTSEGVATKKIIIQR
ncbi:MAG TPA: T9SS type A sorting domain-containing protein [Bacteroidia bacterium]